MALVNTQYLLNMTVQCTSIEQIVKVGAARDMTTLVIYSARYTNKFIKLFSLVTDVSSLQTNGICQNKVKLFYATIILC